MRASILVVTAALLVGPDAAQAQRRAGGAASPEAPRSRAGSEVRSRAPTSGEGRIPRIATPGAPTGSPGSWAGGPASGRPGPYRSTPYGSKPYRATPRYPAPHRPYLPYVPYVVYPYGYSPYGYDAYGYGAYGGLSYRVPSVVVVTPGVVPVAPAAEPGAEAGYEAPRGKLLVVGGGEGAPQLHVETAGDTLLRLRWSGGGPEVREVTLLVLDEERVLLAAQTLREAPYTALFDRSPRAAFAGVAVTYASGASTTTVVPLSAGDGARD